MDSLNQALRAHPNISLKENKMVFELFQRGNKCHGVWSYDQNSHDLELFAGPHTVLATGGLGAVYQYTSNPDCARGDGLALAKRAQVDMQNLEFVQFHPTTLDVPGDGFLLTEAIRGAGAYLRNDKGHRFALDTDPRGELATRDLVARMIWAERQKTGKPVYLDISHRTDLDMSKRFPAIFERLQRHGLNLQKDWIPVVPAEHFACGGVKVDCAGRTSMDSLYACGEVSYTGLHGANRLASTSLLEGLVYGKTIADAVEKCAEPKPTVKPETNEIQKILARDAACSYSEQEKYLSRLMLNHGSYMDVLLQQSKKTMWDKVGIVRSPAKMEEAGEELSYLQSALHSALGGIPSRNVLGEYLKVRNVLDASLSVQRSAVNNPRSIGGHYVVADPVSRPSVASSGGIRMPAMSPPIWLPQADASNLHSIRCASSLRQSSESA